MNIKFLDKVYDQILSETRIIDDKVYTPFYLRPVFPFYFSTTISLFNFSIHCKDVYSLNDKEIEYVWGKYKKGLTALMEKKEPAHQEKGW